jgi:hypothetical protein
MTQVSIPMNVHESEEVIPLAAFILIDVVDIELHTVGQFDPMSLQISTSPEGRQGDIPVGVCLGEIDIDGTDGFWKLPFLGHGFLYHRFTLTSNSAAA